MTPSERMGGNSGGFCLIDALMDLLIDKNGKAWDAGSGTLRQLFNCSVSNAALPGFLVRNMGWASLRVTGDAIAIKVTPGRLSSATYLSMAKRVHARKPRRMSLSWFDGGWTHELVPDPTRALERLMSLMVARRDMRSSIYLVEPRDLSALESHSPLQDVLDAWRETSGALDIDQMPELFHERVGSCYSVIASDATSGQMTFARLGEGMKMYHTGWTQSFVGEPVENQPDLRYGRSVAASWRAAVLSDEPQLMDVDAIVRDPQEQRESRRQYSRLTLPLRSRSTTQLLLSTTIANHSIDLRAAS